MDKKKKSNTSVTARLGKKKIRKLNSERHDLLGVESGPNEHRPDLPGVQWAGEEKQGSKSKRPCRVRWGEMLAIFKKKKKTKEDSAYLRPGMTQWNT